MYHLRRATIAAITVTGVVFLLWLLPKVLNPTPPTKEEQKRDEQWVDSSPYWLDRQACRWLTLCGVHHVKWDAPEIPANGSDDDGHELRWTDLRKRSVQLSDGYATVPSAESWWIAGREESRQKKSRRDGGAKILEEIPQYVLDHAPLVHLYSGETFWPSDIASHVQHMAPFVNGSAWNLTAPLSLENLGGLNNVPAEVFLSSIDDVESRPEWLHSHANRPRPFEDEDPKSPDADHGERGSRDPGLSPDGTTWWDADREHPPHRIADPRRSGRKVSPLERRRIFTRPMQRPIISSRPANKPTKEGYSKAPVVLVMVDKGSGILDAFWFFFYSYNLGQTVADIRFGNHVGDWEHCMVRFENGIPRAMFLSEHAGGKAYAWQALEKRFMKKGKPVRPVIYSAVGSHAMYAMPGDHPYVLPFHMLKDQTDKGPLWDPSLNTYAYFYDYVQDREDKAAGVEPTSLTPAASNPKAPTSWFHFEGWWGDDVYDLSDERQWRLFGQYHYVTGPSGPRFKYLERHKVCQTEKCMIVHSLEEGKKSAWY